MMRIFLLFMLLCFDVKAVESVDRYIPRFNVETNVFTIPRVIIYDSKGNEHLLYDVVGTFNQLPPDLVWKDAACGFSPVHPACVNSGVYYKSVK